jgi:hypothetical protein
LQKLPHYSPDDGNRSVFTRTRHGRQRAVVGGVRRSMHIKIQGGTPISSDSSLCSTCRCSTIVRGRTLDEELVICSALGLRGVQITFKVTSCSDYADRRRPSYMEMMQDAWILQPGSRKRRPGFVRASELEDEEVFELRSTLNRKLGSE